jgi:phosphoserine phosphatase RsbU/P
VNSSFVDTSIIARMKHFFHNLYEILTRDLNRQEFEKMFSEDMRGMYEFYVRSMKSLEGESNKVKRAIKFTWHLFVAFLLKLTPARRVAYAIALFFLLIAITQGRITSALYSFIIVNVLLAMELADKLITKDELTVARDIQLSLQPNGNVVIPGFDVAAYSDVAKQVGGDYYDILSLQEGSSIVVMGDVSGKGISSALYVAKMQTALQLFASESSDLKELLLKLNSHLYGQLKRNYFLSLFVAKLYPDGKADLCRAGHPPGILFQSEKKEILWLKPNGIAVGMAPSSNVNVSVGNTSHTDFGSSLEIQSLYLKQGDVLLLFTDGVSEATGTDGKEFGSEQLAGILKSNANEAVSYIRKKLVQELTRYRGGNDLRDDTTFVLLKKL